MADRTVGVLGAFAFRVDAYVGAPRIIGFVFAATTDDLPTRVYKTFDMDCKVLESGEFYTRLRSIVGSSGRCAARAFYGKRDEQVGASGNVHEELTLTPTVTFELDFDDAGLREYLDTKSIDADPPVLDCKLSNFQWQPSASWAWSRTQWEADGMELLIDDNHINLCFYGSRSPDDFLSPEFSEFEMCF